MRNEFLARPRPCVFLNNKHENWQDRHDYVMWQAGEVVEKEEDLLAVLARAPQNHARFISAQQRLAHDWLGETDGAPARELAERSIRTAHGRAVVPTLCGRKVWTVMPAAYFLQQHAQPFKEFPPRQAPAGFNPGDMLDKVLKTAAAGVGNA